MALEYDETTAFEFRGNWSEFLPIAASNVLLTIATLGIYRFWGITRERRYFWSQTRFIDDRLEWTGTGKELFTGFIAVIFLLLLPLIVLQFVVQALILQDQKLLAALFGILAYLGLLYLVGIAIFRALRYRLSRTRWHGIRGGSDDNGLRFGFSYFWKSIAGFLPLGLLIPRASVSLWRERWNAMSFGPHPFRSSAQWEGLMKRYLLLYLAPFILFIGGLVVGASPGSAMVLTILFAFYVVLPLLALGYYAAYLREVIGTLSLASLDFAFSARTKHWLVFYLVNMVIYALAFIVAAGLFFALTGFSLTENLQPNAAGGANPMLGIALFVTILIPVSLVGPIIRFRTWRFFVAHLEASGEIRLTDFVQSETRSAKHGEGLFESLDVGAV